MSCDDLRRTLEKFELAPLDVGLDEVDPRELRRKVVETAHLYGNRTYLQCRGEMRERRLRYDSVELRNAQVEALASTGGKRQTKKAAIPSTCELALQRGEHF